MGSSVGAVVLLLVGLGLVIAGAELFFGGLLSTAARFGLPAFFLTVVLAGFELENLAAGIAANAKGLGNAAAGTFLGGTTFVALGVAGLGAAIAPIRARLPRGTQLWTAAAPLPLLALGLDGDLSRLDGLILLLWSLAAIAGIAYTGRASLADQLPPPRRYPVARLLGGLTVVTGAGIVLAEGLSRVVTDLGVSQSLLGNTAVAATVEAEEVAKVAVPSRHGRGDLALGNIFGTIAHFTAFNAGIIALVHPIHLDTTSLHLHLPVAVASSVVLVGITARQHGLNRWSGLLLLGLYAAYVAIAIASSV